MTVDIQNRLLRFVSSSICQKTMTPDAYCRNKAAKSGSSFYYSFLFLPDRQRKAIIALYAFCREVDDVTDECADPQVAHSKLQWWRQEVTRLYQSNAQHPVTRALTPVIASFNLSEKYFQEIIDGMEMDLQQNRYMTFKDLSLYCYRVAGVVGLLAAEIFGYQDQHTLKYARDLGMAFQLTNILRDVGEDAGRNRIYLPEEDLKRFNIKEDQILSYKNSDNFIKLIQFQADRARQYYQNAFINLPDRDRYSQRSGIIMATIYQSTLDEIASDGFRVLERRVSLTPLRKFWLAWKTMRLERRRHKNWLKSKTSI